MAARRRKVLKRERYPFLGGCYVDEDFARTLQPEPRGGRVRLEHYKGAMLLSVEHGDHATRAAARKLGMPAPGGKAWLYGDDLDAAIALLREAKRIWLRAYRKAERHLARSRAGRWRQVRVRR